jgi:hypothetical protein
MVKVEVNGIVLHIPDGWDVFSYHGTWYVVMRDGNQARVLVTPSGTNEAGGRVLPLPSTRPTDV